MGPTITKLISLIILSFSLKPQIYTQAQQQVQCMFLFGDSLFDNGNNNVLLTSSKANYRPYGIDYPDGPTGRFSNGRNIADFLAELLGFANPVSPFVTARGSDILRGVNYASGSAGILEESGIVAGDVIALNRQLINHQLTIDRIRVLLGNNQTAVNNYLNKCLYVVNIGTNDYVNNYYLPQLSLSRILNTPDEFAQILIQRFTQQLRTLNNSGARKFAVFGLGLLGCSPQELLSFPTTNGSACVDFINNSVQLFNNRLNRLIDNLNMDLPASQFTFINITNIALGDPSLIDQFKPLIDIGYKQRLMNCCQHGIRVRNASCCAAQNNTGLCFPNQVPCSNRNEYIYWDNIHPTEIDNRATASRSYSALLPNDAHPVDIRRLVQI
ncbi:hypothetical protein CASFOL_039377 [Castilleja foliolosa]|uniref:Uncharacterized protein n=1 Tax=Castilleja foliolosa TaxID=1961234 RepID=A0ABD3BIE8_9LAMI